MTFHTGFIAIVGPPNVGKSTLMNRMVGEKLAIVTPKPQTTRNRILGIRNGEEYQMVFLDTPGIHRTRTALHQSMVASALAAFQEVDLVLLMVAAGPESGLAEETILKSLRETAKPCLLALNKIDRCPKEALLPLMAECGRWHRFEEIIPISALTGDGVEALLQALKARLRPGPCFFPPDMRTDQSEAFWIAEIIREKVYLQTAAEIPYACAVTVDGVEEAGTDRLLRVSARIHVEKASQKGILIGKGGRLIGAIGRSARLELERALGMRVYLDLRVRVEKDWSRDTRALRRLGY